MPVRIANAEESSEIDRQAMRLAGLDGRTLMENAGCAAASLASSMAGCGNGRVAVLCGRGRNGGDGLVAARHLATAGFIVSVAVVPGSSHRQMPGECQANFEVVLRMAESGQLSLITAGPPERAAAIADACTSADLVIDALLGTGAKGRPEGETAEAIRIINRSGRRVLSLDLPSGLPSDGGPVPEDTVKANATICFCAIKQGLLSQPAADYAGRLHLSAIGMPDEMLQAAKGELIDAMLAGSLVPKRRGWFHKGDLGKVGIIAGSRNMPGAAALCAKGALRGGCGTCELFIPQEAYTAVSSYGLPPETMIRLLPSEDGWFSGVLTADAAEALRGKDAIVMGPGMGRSAGAKALLEAVVGLGPKKLILDADALWFLGEDPSLVAGFAGDLTLTPHTGELGRLLGRDASGDGRVQAAMECASRFGATVAHKGPGTVVANPKSRYRAVHAGNSAMATPGSGDVLSGLAGAFAGRGCDGYSAASAACYIHALAGDLAAKKSPQSVLAGEIADWMAEAMRMAFEASEAGGHGGPLPYMEIRRAVELEES